MCNFHGNHDHACNSLHKMGCQKSKKSVYLYLFCWKDITNNFAGFYNHFVLLTMHDSYHELYFIGTWCTEKIQARIRQTMCMLLSDQSPYACVYQWMTVTEQNWTFDDDFFLEMEFLTKTSIYVAWLIDIPYNYS